MKTKDLMPIATSAMLTATLVVAAFSNSLLNASDPVNIAPKIAFPKYSGDGVQMTLGAADDRVFRAGEQPEFELAAVNTLDQPASTTVCVTMSGMTPTSPLSRMMPMPTVFWKETRTVTLNARETKLIKLSTATNLPPNHNFTVTLGKPEPATTNTASHPLIWGLNGIAAFTFSTVILQANPPLVVGAFNTSNLIAR